MDEVVTETCRCLTAACFEVEFSLMVVMIYDFDSERILVKFFKCKITGI